MILKIAQIIKDIGLIRQTKSTGKATSYKETRQEQKDLRRKHSPDHGDNDE
jgi:hypothetical protein